MNKTEKIIIIIGIALICLGIVISLFNFNKLFEPFISDKNLEERIAYIDNENLTKLTVSSSNEKIIIIPATSDKIKITYYEDEYNNYTIEETSNSYKLSKKSKIFQLNFTWFKYRPEITIEVPDKYMISYDIKTSNGRIEMNNLEFIDATLKTSNGKIIVDSIKGNSLDIKTSNGGLNLENVTTQNTYLKTSNGTINLEKVSSNNQIIGDTNNGKIKFSNLFSPKIDFETSNGKITGDIIGNVSDYKRDIKTSNGYIKINGIEYGKKLYDDSNNKYNLKLKASNGRIEIDFKN